MKKSLKNCILVISILISYTPVYFSQNLVPNGSFEVYEICPNEETHINSIIPIPWDSPPTYSVDYFNSCSDYIGCDVPSHGLGYQNSKEGEGYVGLHILNSSHREYIQTKLIDSLSTNYCYYICFYINLSNTSKFASKNIYANLSKYQNLTTNSGNVLALDKNISPFNNKFIIDTLNWVSISGIFKSVENELYITIGNFNLLNNIDTLRVNENGYNGSYYYIDDIRVEEISTVDELNNILANEIYINKNDSIFLGHEINDLNRTWYQLPNNEVLADSISGIWVSPTETTTYVVKQELCGAITYDTVTVFVSGVGLFPPLEGDKGGGQVQIIPNPNSGTFSLKLNKNIVITELHLLDELGRKLQTLDPKAEHFDLKLNKGNDLSLSKGIYFLEMKTEKSRNIEKIVVN